MNITVETSSRIDDSEYRVQTREMNVEDWVLPTFKSRQLDDDETTPSNAGTSPNGATGTTLQQPASKVSAPIPKEKLWIQLPPDRIKLQQQWECVVLGVSDECVECEMHDLTDESEPVEYAEVYLDEFNNFDKELLEEGAVFYWSIGHVTKKTGQVRRYSDLRVRRMPRLSSIQRREITQRARILSESINKKGK